MFALTGWKTVEINGIEFELNSILVEKWKGKTYRLVIQRQRRIEGDLAMLETITAVNGAVNGVVWGPLGASLLRNGKENRIVLSYRDKGE